MLLKSGLNPDLVMKSEISGKTIESIRNMINFKCTVLHDYWELSVDIQQDVRLMPEVSSDLKIL